MKLKNGISLEERFWSKVMIHANGCWEYMGSKLFCIAPGIYKPSRYIAWKFIHKEYPKGKLRRQCSTKQCVNPNHFLNILNDENRFWNKVKKSDSGCWEWSGFRNPEGYGIIKMRNSIMLAHRFSYEIHNGKFDPSLDVLHYCDNSACVNPDHLYLGTDIENSQDRQARGQSNLAKLTIDDVLEMKLLFSRDVPVPEIAEKYELNTSSIYAIRRGTNWGWVEDYCANRNPL